MSDRSGSDLDEETYEIEAVEDRWQEPQADFFRFERGTENVICSDTGGRVAMDVAERI
jgi:hypothetical protein